MSFSAGLVQAEPEDTIDQVVERADKTMYQAKASGAIARSGPLC